MARERAGEKNAPKLLTVREVIVFATVQGAKDNALDHKVGTLTPSTDADIVLLRHDRINVDTVFIAGRMMKQDGDLVGVDLARINKLARESRDYILAKAGFRKTRVR